MRKNFPKIHDAFSKKGKVSRAALMMNREMRKVLEGIQVNGRQISSEEDCEIVKAKLICELYSLKAGARWDALLCPYGVLSFENTFSNEKLLHNILDMLYKAQAFPKKFSIMKKLFEEMGVKWRQVMAVSRFDSTQVIVEKAIDSIPQLKSLCAEIESTEKEKQVELLMNKAMTVAERIGEFSVLGEMLERDLTFRDFESYRVHYQQIETLLRKEKLFKDRQLLLERLKNFAPEWSTHIKEKKSAHGMVTLPENLKLAIRCKMLRSAVAERGESAYADYYQEMVRLEDVYSSTTEEYIRWKVMHHMISALSNEPRLVRTLKEFRLAVQKLGKGTGKKAVRLKKEIGALFKQIQKVIPVWIMPVSKVYEIIEPGTFELMIMDEASQCDITALPALSAGRRLLIIGDDEQISPNSIGIKESQMETLESAYLSTVENSYIFDLKTSVFSIAGLFFGRAIPLLEHFRCKPQIIEFSNKLSYKGKLQSMKSPLSALGKPVNGIQVQGIRDGKVNMDEAEAIVDKVIEMIEDERYEKLSFGVISLMGRAQANLIQQSLMERIPLKKLEQHKVICDVAMGFQGDERDVILISCVDAKQIDGKKLKRQGVGVEDSNKKRLNVAMSRAKEQIFVYHSFEQSDLDVNDIRQKILQWLYQDDDDEQDGKAIALSDFQTDVVERLRTEGYNVQTGVEIGNKLLPICVMDGGKTVVISCLEDKNAMDLGTLRVLERVGYEVIFMRPESFYLGGADPGKKPVFLDDAKSNTK